MARKCKGHDRQVNRRASVLVRVPDAPDDEGDRREDERHRHAGGDRRVDVKSRAMRAFEQKMQHARHVVGDGGDRQAFDGLLQAQLQAQQAYLNSIAQQQAGNGNGLLTGGPFGTTPVGDADTSGQAPKQRRVIYREVNSPLAAPPRLFNPDQ